MTGLKRMLYWMLLVLLPVLPSTVQAQQTHFWEKGLVGKVFRYFDKADDVKPLDRFDFSVIGGPEVNSTTGVGLGICGSGLYHLQPSNPSLHQSAITLTAKGTTKAMFSLLLINDNFLPDDRYRTHARLELTTFKNLFWGIGFEADDRDANESRFSRNQAEFEGSFLFRCAPSLYIGPAVYYNFFTADKRDSLCNSLLEGRPHKTQVLALGANLTYDTRDQIYDAHRGMYVNLQQYASPAPFNSTSGLFSTTDLQVCGYQPAWKGCVIAGELHTKVNCGHATPWTQYAQVGSNNRMRGYYQGRYRDRNIVEAQVEFRQHLWKRFGMVWWLGASNAFHDTHTWQFGHTLANAGLGVRWRFKPGVNVRLDYGFTRNGSGIVFCINEAF